MRESVLPRQHDTVYQKAAATLPATLNYSASRVIARSKQTFDNWLTRRDKCEAMASTRAKVNDYITRSFRDIADEDYVAARALYRDGLDRQFLWAALQSVEKYLKAILVYNRISIKGLGHKISLALEKVRSISNSPFKIPQSVENFIKKLQQQGVDRYFEQPVNTDGLGLLELDLAVYYLRKYCRAVRPDVGTPAPPINGRLEEILNKPSRARDDLVWKNLFFGRRKKKSVTFGRRTKWANPGTFISPEIFPELDRIIHFSKPVRCHFLRLLERNKNAVPRKVSGITKIQHTLPSQDVHRSRDFT